MTQAKAFAALLFLCALSSWYAPGFNGLWAEPSNVTPGEGRIAAAVFFVGSLLLWFREEK